MKTLSSLFLFLSFSLVYSQQDSIPTQNLDEVVLEVTKIPSNFQTPIAASVVLTARNAHLEPQLSLNESLISIPGLFAQNAYNYNQDLRVSIRGFGARAAFGIRGVKLIVDGIPETTPDGQGQIDNVLVGLINRIEVLRGPAASLYGNASGGVIYINSLNTIEEQLRLNFTAGSYGLALAQALINLDNKDKKALLAINYTQSDGYRSHSGFRQLQTNYKQIKQLNKNNKLLWQLNYTHSPKAHDAGGLTLDQANENHRAARTSNIDYNAREAINHIKTGWQLSTSFDNSTLSNRLYFAHRAFEGFLPFETGGVSAFKRFYWGVGSSYQTRFNDLILELGWSHDRQTDQRKRYDNLSGIKGDLQGAQTERYNNTAAYLMANKQMGLWTINSGIRADQIGISLKGSNEHQSYLALNPSLGIHYQLTNQSGLYTRYSESFETPTLSEISNNPNGSLGFNSELKPNKAKNFEVGYKLQTNSSQLELTLFSIQSSDELISYSLEDYPGRSFYKNAGSTKRNGVELSLQKQWGKFKFLQVYSFSDFKFNYLNNNKQLPGIPKHNTYNRISKEFTERFELALTSVYWGNLFANSTNTVQVRNQFYSHLSMNKKLKLKRNQLNIKMGINNIFNSSYYDNIRVNAWGGRFYEPAPKRNFYIGVLLGID